MSIKFGVIKVASYAFINIDLATSSRLYLLIYELHNLGSLRNSNQKKLYKMKYSVFFRALLIELLFQPFALALNQAASSIRSIYLFKDVMKSDTTSLKTSGFNSVMIFGVGILGNGDIMVIV